MAEKEKNEPTLRNFQRIAASRLSNIQTFDEFVEYCKILWCKRYNRPLKDPLLGCYTPFELIFEVSLWGFLDDSQKLDQFILADNTGKSAILNDEEWFKDKMGEGYVTDEIILQGGKERWKSMASDVPEGVTEF